MTNKPDRVNLGNEGHQSDGDYEGLLASYVDRLLDGEEFDHERVLEEHPEVGQQLLDDLQSFIDPAACAPAAPLGTLGDYTLSRQIGRGGMGVVYEAWESSMDRRVALKVLPAGIAADNKSFMRFMREAKAAGQLAHQNVVPVFSMGVKEQTPYYAMEYVEGATLGQVLGEIREAGADAETVFGKKDSVVYFGKLAEAFADVADGLQHAHSKGVIHRDIKPSNLILDGEGRLRILDFGLAHLEGQESLTLSGDVVGTPSYMSPEQARAKKDPIDHRTDVYSLGATMYEALILRPPFKGKNHQDTLSQIIERDPQPPRQLNPRVPQDLETIVLKCLRKDIADRYGTAEALGQDLRRFVRGDPIEARPEGVWELWKRRAWRARARLAAAGIVLTFLIVIVLLMLKSYEGIRANREREYENHVLAAAEALELGRFEGRLELGRVWERERLAGDFGVGAGPVAAGPLRAGLDGLETAISLDPKRRDARYHRARALRLLGDERAAVEELRELLSEEPDFVPAHTLLAAIHAARGESTDTARELQAAERLGAVPWSDAWYRADLEMARGDWLEAERAYDEILLEAETAELYLGASLHVLLGRGIARMEARKYDEAIRDFSAAATSSPSALAPILLLGQVYLLEEEPEKADAWFEEYFVRGEPAGPAAREIVGLFLSSDYFRQALKWTERMAEGLVRERFRVGILRHLSRFGEALDAGERALEHEPEDPLTFALLGKVWMSCSDRERAEAYLESALETGGDDPFVRFQTAWAYVLGDDYDSATEHYERAVELARKNYLPRYHLAWTYHETGRSAEARALLLERVESDLRSVEHALLGEIYWSESRFEEAVSHLKAALEIAPGDPTLLWDLRFLRRDWQEFERGEEILDLYQSALEDAPREPSNLVELGLLQIVREEWDRAEETLRRAVELDPDLPGPRHALVDLLTRRGRFNEALAVLCDRVPATPAGCYPGGLRDFARRLSDLLRWRPRPGQVDCLDALVDSLESYAADERCPPEVLEACALVCLNAPGKPDPERAADLAQRALNATDSKNAKLLATLSSAQFAAGQPEAAIRTLEEGALGTKKHSIHLQYAEYLLDDDRPAQAETHLQGVVESGIESRPIWELWAQISLCDLELGSGELLADLPRSDSAFALDLRWLFDQLETTGAVGINAGAGAYVDSDGRPWGRDRFSTGGKAQQYEGDRELQARADDALYRTCRSFPERGDYPPGYRIPLPPAEYRVTLHFAEISPWIGGPGERVFDIIIEGKSTKEFFDPFAVGSSTAERVVFELRVADGRLDIGFRPRVRDPIVSAIEVRKR